MPQLCVAYSGGIDSHVLLHALHTIRSSDVTYSLRAIHIHHGLHPNADQWEQHCRLTCESLNIPFASYRLHITPQRGKSIEALARDARYACLAQHLEQHEYLLTAHHADDQAETFLLQLLRGSGIAGLASMAPQKKFFHTHLLRPLLDISRERIQHYAVEQGLQWIEDDSNQSVDYARNYIRHQVLPHLITRWPSALNSISRSAKHCAEAYDFANEIAAEDLLTFPSQKTLDIRILKNFSSLRQKNIVRYWIKQQGCLAPSAVQLDAIFRDVIYSRYEAHPILHWGTYAIRREYYTVFLQHTPS